MHFVALFYIFKCICSDDDYADDHGESDEEEEDMVGDLRSEDDDRFPSDFDDVEKKSRFTEYSMTSSVIRRNDQLTLLDDRFEKVSRKVCYEGKEQLLVLLRKYPVDG